MPCICTNIPARRAMTLYLPNKSTVAAAFHLDCEEHGISVLKETDLVCRRERIWITKQEAPRARTLPNVRLVQRSADGSRAEIEFDVWEAM